MDEASLQLERHYNEIGPSLRLYFRRHCLVEGADDLLQETFLRAWRHRERLQSAVSPRAYLFGIARHVSVDARRRSHPADPLDPNGEPLDSEQSEPDERVDALRAAISGLPEAHREALRLKLQHELSYAEIAEVLEIPVGTVRSRLHHAVRQLVEQLNPTAETNKTGDHPL